MSAQLEKGIKRVPVMISGLNENSLGQKGRIKLKRYYKNDGHTGAFLQRLKNRHFFDIFSSTREHLHHQRPETVSDRRQGGAARVPVQGFKASPALPVVHWRKRA